VVEEFVLKESIMKYSCEDIKILPA